MTSREEAEAEARRLKQAAIKAAAKGEADKARALNEKAKLARHLLNREE